MGAGKNKFRSRTVGGPGIVKETSVRLEGLHDLDNGFAGEGYDFVAAQDGRGG